MSNLPPGDERPAIPDDTGLPLLRTWPAVYAAVTAIFALWVVLLRLLTEMFS